MTGQPDGYINFEPNPINALNTPHTLHTLRTHTLQTRSPTLKPLKKQPEIRNPTSPPARMGYYTLQSLKWPFMGFIMGILRPYSPSWQLISPAGRPRRNAGRSGQNGCTLQGQALGAFGSSTLNPKPETRNPKPETLPSNLRGITSLGFEGPVLVSPRGGGGGGSRVDSLNPGTELGFRG